MERPGVCRDDIVLRKRQPRQLPSRDGIGSLYTLIRIINSASNSDCLQTLPFMPRCQPLSYNAHLSLYQLTHTVGAPRVPDHGENQNTRVPGKDSPWAQRPHMWPRDNSEEHTYLMRCSYIRGYQCRTSFGNNSRRNWKNDF